MLRTIGAVIAGYVIIAILVILSTILTVGLMLPNIASTPTTSYLIVNLILGLLAAVIGGYCAALIARAKKLTPAISLAAIVFIFGLLSLGQSSNQPVWYPYALLVIGPLGVVIGGLLHQKLLTKK